MSKYFIQKQGMTHDWLTTFYVWLHWNGSHYFTYAMWSGKRLQALQCSVLPVLCQRNECRATLASWLLLRCPWAKTFTLIWCSVACFPAVTTCRLFAQEYNVHRSVLKEIVSTHRPCRWDNIDPARTRDPHTPSEGRLPQNTTPPRLAHIGISHMETPAEQWKNSH